MVISRTVHKKRSFSHAINTLKIIPFFQKAP